ncbi:mediator-associated protein 2 isoform X3 [Senna tora]|uniref:Mediator-associated protein 2 isoform X3 n=1 Tax=Senna tora TaxID=362788 RepID=A0A834X3P0_9FABA|nr:mediator-associated protein 2 isoform X3 [Senna tora]
MAATAKTIYEKRKIYIYFLCISGQRRRNTQQLTDLASLLFRFAAGGSSLLTYYDFSRFSDWQWNGLNAVWGMAVEGAGVYRPPPEFEEDTNGPLIDLNLTDSTELWLLQLPFGEDLLADIEGQELSLKLHGDGQLASFEGPSGKVYDFISFAAQEPDETVFVSSAEEPKIAGKISRRVSIVHYPDPKELVKVNLNNKRRNPSGTMMTTTSSHYFPMQSGKGRSSLSGRAASTQGSRPRSSVSEVAEPSNTPKRRRVSESSQDVSVSESKRRSKQE